MNNRTFWNCTFCNVSQRSFQNHKVKSQVHSSSDLSTVSLLRAMGSWWPMTCLDCKLFSKGCTVSHFAKGVSNLSHLSPVVNDCWDPFLKLRSDQRNQDFHKRLKGVGRYLLARSGTNVTRHQKQPFPKEAQGRQCSLLGGCNQSRRRNP